VSEAINLSVVKIYLYQVAAIPCVKYSKVQREACSSFSK